MPIKTSGSNDDENNRLSGHMRRYARVGNSVAGWRFSWRASAFVKRLMQSELGAD